MLPLLVRIVDFPPDAAVDQPSRTVAADPMHPLLPQVTNGPELRQPNGTRVVVVSHSSAPRKHSINTDAVVLLSRLPLSRSRHPWRLHCNSNKVQVKTVVRSNKRQGTHSQQSTRLLMFWFRVLNQPLTMSNLSTRTAWRSTIPLARFLASSDVCCCRCWYCESTLPIIAVGAPLFIMLAIPNEEFATAAWR